MRPRRSLTGPLILILIGVAFLTRNLRISLTDERGDGYHVDFHYEGGIEDYVTFLNLNKDPLGKKVIFFAGDGPEGEEGAQTAIGALIAGWAR